MKKEHLGAIIDAVYAISMTMLALDIPVEIKAQDVETLRSLIEVLIQYCLSFAMLFGFWLQHRQVHQYLPPSRISLWISAALLLVTTLIPRATTLVYEHGDRAGTIFQLNFSEIIDIAFIFTILLADLLMGQLVLQLKLPADPSLPNFNPIRQLRKSKAIITLSMVAVTIAILLIPAANRNLLWLIAFLLFLQNDITACLDKLVPFNKEPPISNKEEHADSKPSSSS